VTCPTFEYRGLSSPRTSWKTLIGRRVEVGISQLTNLWYMQGMPWPMDELKRRKKDDVAQEAIRRLKSNLVRDYDHAFAGFLPTVGRPSADAFV